MIMIWCISLMVLIGLCGLQEESLQNRRNKVFLVGWFSGAGIAGVILGGFVMMYTNSLPPLSHERKNLDEQTPGQMYRAWEQKANEIVDRLQAGNIVNLRGGEHLCFQEIVDGVYRFHDQTNKEKELFISKESLVFALNEVEN